MIAQTALSTGGVVQVQAAEDTYVKTDELNRQRYGGAEEGQDEYRQRISSEYQKQELDGIFATLDRITFNEIEWENITAIRLRMRSLN